jgi:GDPmannose 4,6-dehydratase
MQDKIRLGNLDARRDWGFAGDYTDAMWRMLQADEAEDYVIATGETHSIREFLDVAFARINIDNWESYIETDAKFMRPAEVDLLLGDSSKAKAKLGWAPTVSFTDLVAMMVDADLADQRERHQS